MGVYKNMKVMCINDFDGKFRKDGVIEGKEYEGTFGPIQEGRLGVWTIEGIRGTVFPGYMFEDADRVVTFEKVMDGNVYLNVKTNRKIKYYNGSIWMMGGDKPGWQETNIISPIELNSLWLRWETIK